MADRRMFSKKIIDTDLFLDMPISTRLLYYDLSMRADDDGFVSSPKKITRLVGCSEDDMKLLIAKQFIIPFESGVCVIRGWRIHNYIQNDRYHETQYLSEKHQLSVEKNGLYTLCIQDASNSDTQVRLGKDRLELGKDNINNSCGKNKDYISLKFIDEVIDKVNLTLEQYNKLIDKFGSEIVDKTILALDNYIANGKGNKYKDHFRVLNTWCNKDASSIKSTGKKSNVEKGLELIKKYENEESEGGGKSVWDV